MPWRQRSWQSVLPKEKGIEIFASCGDVSWAAFVSSISLGEFKAESWLKYFSVPASGNNHSARLSCYAGLGCLFCLSKHVRTNLPLILVCFDFCPSLPLPCYSWTCPSACLAICTFPGCRGGEGPGLLQGALHLQHSILVFLSSPIFSSKSTFLMPFVPPLVGPLFLTFLVFVNSTPFSPSNLWFLFGNCGVWCQIV